MSLEPLKKYNDETPAGRPLTFNDIRDLLIDFLQENKVSDKDIKNLFDQYDNLHDLIGDIDRAINSVQGVTYDAIQKAIKRTVGTYLDIS